VILAEDGQERARLMRTWIERHFAVSVTWVANRPALRQALLRADDSTAGAVVDAGLPLEPELTVDLLEELRQGRVGARSDLPVLQVSVETLGLSLHRRLAGLHVPFLCTKPLEETPFIVAVAEALGLPKRQPKGATDGQPQN
jgi:hypothetical protein